MKYGNACDVQLIDYHRNEARGNLASISPFHRSAAASTSGGPTWTAGEYAGTRTPGSLAIRLSITAARSPAPPAPALTPRQAGFGNFVVDVPSLLVGTSSLVEIAGVQTGGQWLELLGPGGGGRPPDARSSRRTSSSRHWNQAYT